MTAERTRSEYRLPLVQGQFEALTTDIENLGAKHRQALAELMLDAYQGTIDDEGETIVEALEVIDYSLDHCLREHSFVLMRNSQPIAMSLMVVVDGTHYIDPVAVSAAHKNGGLGRQMVETSLASAADAGVTEIGATITDGNSTSERLFASLGAQRIGPWPPAR